MENSTKSQRMRILIASLLGTTIEWYDYLLYGTAASLVFGTLFFPSKDPLTGLLLSYATFSVALLSRPLGSILFSRLGDKVGRKSVLMITLIGMGVFTSLIGFLPGYEVIGIWAPILLTITRFMQGVFVGGEWGGVVVYLSEHAPKGKKGLYGSIPQIGVPLGLLLSVGAMSIMNILAKGDAFMEWGWRVPFIASFVLILIGFWMRRGIPESEVFNHMKESNQLSQNPLSETLKYHWPSVLKLVGSKFGENVSYYIFTVFVIFYATNTGFSKGDVLSAINISAVICIFTILGFGYLSDILGKRKILMFGCLGLILFAIPYFYLLGQSYTWLVFVTVIGVGVIWPCMYSVQGALYPELFPAKVRYTGASLGQQIAGPLAGGLAPFIATYVYSNQPHSYLALAAYLIISGLISLISVLSIPSTQVSDKFDQNVQNVPTKL